MALFAAFAGAASVQTVTIPEVVLRNRGIPRAKSKQASPNKSNRNRTKTAYLKRCSMKKANKRKRG